MLKKLLYSLAKNPWKSYALSIGADYVEGGFHSDRIIVNEERFQIFITLGTNQRGNRGFRYTRFRCAYTSDQSPYFSIRNKKFHLASIKGIFSKKKQELPLQKLYKISAPKEEIISILFKDEAFCALLNTFSDFTFLSEKDDGEYGPSFLTTEHQLCLELEGEIEDPQLLSAGIGIILATIGLLQHNDLLRPEKSSVKY